MLLDAIEKIKKTEEAAAFAEKAALINGKEAVRNARLEAEKVLVAAKAVGEEYIQKAVSNAMQIAKAELKDNTARIEEKLKETEEQVYPQLDAIIEEIYKRLIAD